jgi:hypothetical protein
MAQQKVSFIDSSLVTIERSEQQSVFKFENVYISGKLRFADIVLNDIREVTCDGQIVEAVEIKYDDGEVLDLTTTATRLSMDVQWVDYENRTEELHTYKVECGSIAVVVGNLVP